MEVVVEVVAAAGRRLVVGRTDVQGQGKVADHRHLALADRCLHVGEVGGRPHLAG
ncbi:hypothetical protein [Kitasatospora sp. KL5]|uniref:hypothetical protein n=1 Tax=Kitasatospora sp. KL5 TaxID=3425125 RepID=UPI003D6E6A8E